MPRLLGVFARVWDLTEPYRPMEDLDADEAGRLHGDHERMLAAFTAGDVDELLDAAREHHDHLAAHVRARPEPAVADAGTALRPARRRPRPAAR